MEKNPTGDPEEPLLEDLISVAEASRLRGVSRSAIWNLIDRGKLRTIRRFNLVLLYRKEVLEYRPSKGGRPRKAPRSRPRKPAYIGGTSTKPARRGMLKTTEFAQAVGAPYATVMGWLREGRISGAVFDTSGPRGGIWWVPRSAIAKFKDPETRPHRGRRRKEK